MQSRNQFSCFIIGEGTLPIQCGEILLNGEHEICGIISPDEVVNRWAQGKNISHADASDDLIKFLRKRPFDYLFSIVNVTNYQALLQASLELPRKGAINYHDAFLPRYAGFYPTSWALMNREATHGVTWHWMTDQIDAGDILRECPVDISSNDTAFTLNAKCYDAAIRSFAGLVEDLSAGRSSTRKQDLDERTFFPLHQRPRSGCVISWNRYARDIDAFVRALDFGPYPNPLGLPKVRIGKEFFIVPQIDVLDSVSDAPPGTITAIDHGSLKVSTADREVVLRQLLTIDGQPLAISDLVVQLELREGDRFSDLEQHIATRIATRCASVCEHEDFWVRKLATLQPVTLPCAARHAASVDHDRYATLPVPIPEEAIIFLERRANWSTDFLLAAFAAYIARIAGVSRFDIGFSYSELQRSLLGLEGFFASQVPLRVDVDYAQSFGEHFKAVREQVNLVKRHGTYARDTVARYPSIRSDPHLQKGPTLPVSVQQIEQMEHYASGSEFGLVIPEDRAQCLWVYDADVFNENDVVRMAGQFATFLKGIVTDPDRRPIAEIPLLTAEERRRLLVEFNNTETDYPHDRCLHQLFEAQVERTPEVIALVAGDTQVTYRELNARADQLAHYLAKLGVGPETPVAICVERSVETVVGLLGILKAGGAYVPLHPDYPQERFGLILTDTEAPLLLTQKRLVPRLPEHRAKIICLDVDWKTIAREQRQPPSGKATPDNVAYVVYTSGSTGKPNGVMIEHRSLVNYLCWVNKSLLTDELEIVPAVSRLNFDASLKQLFAPLIRGGQVWVLSDDVVTQPVALLRAISTRPTVGLNCVPSLWLAILDAINSGQAAPPAENFTSLFLGGEPLSKDLVQNSMVALPHLRVWNLYGPTETTANATAGQILSEGEPTIGQPIANTQIYILDTFLNPVPIGLPGELYIGGVGLARGYLNRSELTAEKFIPNPFSSEPGARFYKSGDLARYLPDGNIEFLGRIDKQVKIRGFRIELGEIEAALRQHPAVTETVVLARDDVENPKSAIENLKSDKRLVAYVVLNHVSSPTAGELRSFLKAKLPEYMVPSSFVFLDFFPLTLNGKIDRKALPAPDQRRPELEEQYVAPRTSGEEIIAGIWAEVLKLETVGVHDNFFALGGHSLLATQIIPKVLKMFQVELPVRSFFEAPTVARLAKLIETIHWTRESQDGRIESNEEREQGNL
jgi:amino acid adenylation domain-containing protein